VHLLFGFGRLQPLLQYKTLVRAVLYQGATSVVNVLEKERALASVLQPPKPLSDGQNDRIADQSPSDGDAFVASGASHWNGWPRSGQTFISTHLVERLASLG
jgi:hypothetical protein